MVAVRDFPSCDRVFGGCVCRLCGNCLCFGDGDLLLVGSEYCSGGFRWRGGAGPEVAEAASCFGDSVSHGVSADALQHGSAGDCSDLRYFLKAFGCGRQMGIDRYSGDRFYRTSFVDRHFVLCDCGAVLHVRRRPDCRSVDGLCTVGGTDSGRPDPVLRDDDLYQHTFGDESVSGLPGASAGPYHGV